jgi:exodeoxyribonuclease V gamma subunit
VRSLLDTRLKGRPTRANFRTGDLTICTLVPMRSVPHRVVALLGLDDGAFPRHPETDGDDLLLAEPRVGDRDARSEDRQLLLDALLAATDHLIVTYSGRDERTNRPRPAAVPVAELLDALDATARRADGAPARRQVLIQHPLQPFDARNFAPGDLAGQEPWSYDRVHLAGARAAADQQPPVSWLSAPLPPVDEPVIQLDYLVNFVEHPTRAFLRRRLGLYLSERSDQLLDALPLELDALEKWGVGDRLVDAVVVGTDAERALGAERGRGLLPPGALADTVLSGIASDVNALARAITALGFEPGPADSLDVRVDLPDGRTLIGTVPNLRGDSLLVCTFSRLAAKHRLAAWVRFLAVSAARPELAVTALTVGRGRGHQPPQVSRLVPLGATPGERRERALGELTALVELYDRGMCAPLPLVCATSAAWAEARSHANSEEESAQAADNAWRDGLFPGETSDIEHRYVWGGRVRLEELQREAPGPAERGPGWPGTESSRFGVLARRLWDPILVHEQLGPAQ